MRKEDAENDEINERITVASERITVASRENLRTEIASNMDTLAAPLYKTQS